MKQGQFPAVLPLASLNGQNGFKLDGESTVRDRNGWSVSSAGDLNGDGYSDLVIGAPYATSDSGRSYVVFGGAEVGSNGMLALASLNGTNGFRLDGETSDDLSGWAVNVAGDINGDGNDDLIIGAFNYANSTGRSYVVFGGQGVGSNGVLALSSLNGTNGFKLDGEVAGDESGISVSGVGDINGDKYDDLVIGAYDHGYYVGRSYVVFGGRGVGSDGVLALSSLNGTNGFKLDGEGSGGGQSGSSVSGAGDINGDGNDDLIIGAFSYSGTGRSYVVFGGEGVGSDGVLPLSSLNGTNGFKLDGENNNDHSGVSVSGVGDINGDGYDDLLIGAYGHDNSTGRSYVVFGGVDVGSSGMLALSSLNGTNGFKLDGEATNDFSGYSVSGMGNINGDECDDLLIGAYGHDNSTGRSYLVLGGSGIGSSGVLALSSLNGTNGFKLDGEVAGDWSGWSVSGAGDVNGDGYDDLLIGAPIYANNIGRSYVVFGNSTSSIQILTNQLTIHSAEAVILTSNNLYATGTDIPIFNIFNNQHGYFELFSNPAQEITTFNQSQVVAGQIQFIHDGSQSAPSYVVQATGPTANSTLQAANVIFYRSPVITTNELLIHQGEAVVMNASLLNVTDDYPSNQVFFIINECLHGEFQLLPSNDSLVQFTEEQLSSGLVTFKQDGSNSTPSYQVGVNDPYFTLPATSTVTTTFYRSPVFIANQLSVLQGRTVLFNSSMLGVSDDYPDGQVSFLIENVQHGQFELISDGNSSTVQFTQEQVKTGQIQFVHDNTSSAPSYNVTVSDEFFTVGPQAASIDFDAQPILETNQLTINQGETITVSAENLYASHTTGPEGELSFIISDCRYGHFAWTNSPTQSITTFQQQNITNSRVLFIHNNSVTAPSYDVVVSDGRLSSPIQAASIDFDALPVLEDNILWIDQGQTVVLNSTNLKASHNGYIDPELSFLISNLQHGHFQWTNTTSTITVFQQENITNGLVSFTHDNSRSPPSYLVSATDGRAASSTQAAAIYFNRTPGELEQNSISLGVILGAALGGAAVIVAGCLYAGYKYRQKSQKKSELHLQSTDLSFPLLEETPAEVPAIALEDLKYDETKGCIGSGGYASVYQGTYQGNPVAIKRLHAHHISEKALREFKQEAGIMASVSSEFIVQLRGVYFEPPTACIIMELMPQYSLYQLLSNSPDLSLPVLLQIGLDVIHGLQDLHIKNILHRDLKSLNVLLNDRLRAKVSDFGMSKLQSEIGSGLSSQAGIKGTLLWAAPELFSEKPKYSKSADIYAYGLILWELMVKPYRRPFSNVDLTYEGLRSEKLSRKDQEEIASDWSKPLAQLMRECWDKKPNKRPSAMVVAKSLEQIFTAEQKSHKQLITGPSGPIATDSGVFLDPRSVTLT